MCPPHAAAGGTRSACGGRQADADGESGGDKWAKYTSAGEISWGDFTGPQKYFWHPAKQRYEISSCEEQNGEFLASLMENQLKRIFHFLFIKRYLRQHTSVLDLFGLMDIDEEAVNTPFLFFAGELSYLRFTGSQKYF